MRQKPPDRTAVCRLTDAAEWRASQQQGTVIWRGDDVKSGFLHLSAPHQVCETAEKHFTDNRRLIILMFETAALGADLKWELAPKRGARFPHYYGSLDTDLVVATKTLIRAEGGWRWLKEREEGEERTGTKTGAGIRR